MNLTVKSSRSSLSDVPNTTGVYLFYKNDSIIYIGKSNNLKARLKSHFENAKLDQKEALITGTATRIECIITDSDFNAILLESSLIKKYTPLYNSRWRDDKSYLYIKITVKDDYPKIYPVRKEEDHRSLYFGPFSSNQNVSEILKEVRRIFPFCTQKKLSKRACFYAKIGYCRPCPNEINKITDATLKTKLKTAYRKNIRQVIKVLNGQTDLILSSLYKKLNGLRHSQSYEEAITVRDKIARFENLLTSRSFQTENFSYNLSEKSTVALLAIIRLYYSQVIKLSRIECYDISNAGGKDATASLVVYNDGLVDKSQYRRFKIKNTSLRSDFEMLDETLTRRFTGHTVRNKWPTPDLIVIDGGKPQLRFIQRTMAKLDLAIPFIGIAKRPDRLIIGHDLSTIRPKINNLGFNLVRAIRDESHRFAKKYHLHLRNKKMML